jgi:tetratricopeptide (TPR) repeat protein
MNDELGVAPGYQLRDLQEAIIAGREIEVGRSTADTALVVASATTPGTNLLVQTDRQIPRQLPPDNGSFVGRNDELETLIATLNYGNKTGHAPVIVALHGPGGIGKSALAIRAAHVVSNGYPDGQLYVDLQGASPGLDRLAPVDVLGRFLRAHGAPVADLPANEAELAGRFRTQLADRRVLILLDNAATVEQLIPLLPASSGCAVLVTSRRQLVTLPAVHLRTAQLDAAAAVELLASIVGQDRVLAESDAAAEIARSCGYGPLALRIVGARLAGHPELAISTLAQRIGSGQWRDLDGDDLSVRSSFDASYAELVRHQSRSGHRTREVVAAQAFRLLGLLQTPEITVPAVAALLPAPIGKTELVLDLLAELHLIESTGVPGRFRMHDLLRLYSRDLAHRFDSQEDRTAALHRAHEWYLAAVAEVSRWINSSRWNHGNNTAATGVVLNSSEDAVAWLDAELANLVALASRAAEEPELFGEPLTRLVPMVANTLQKRGRWHEVETLAKLAAETARQRGDQDAEASALASLSACNWRADRYDQAEQNLLRSLLLRQATGDRVSEGRALHNLGWLYQRMGRLPKAVEHFELSLKMLEAHAEPIWVGMVLHNLGEAHFQSRDYRRAEGCLERSLTIRREQNDAGGLCITLVALGRTYAQRGRPQVALSVLSEGVRRCHEVGNREDEWEALLIRSEVLLRMRRPAEAEPVINQVLAMTRRLQNDYGEAAAQRQLSRALFALGKDDPAQSAQERAKAIFADLSTAPDGVLEDFLDGPPPD